MLEEELRKPGVFFNLTDNVEVVYSDYTDDDVGDPGGDAVGEWDSDAGEADDFEGGDSDWEVEVEDGDVLDDIRPDDSDMEEGGEEDADYYPDESEEEDNVFVEVRAPGGLKQPFTAVLKNARNVKIRQMLANNTDWELNLAFAKRVLAMEDKNQREAGAGGDGGGGGGDEGCPIRSNRVLAAVSLLHQGGLSRSQYLGTLYTVHCTLYTVHCTLYTVHCTLYTVHCTLYTVHCTLYTVH